MVNHIALKVSRFCAKWPKFLINWFLKRLFRKKKKKQRKPDANVNLVSLNIALSKSGQKGKKQVKKHSLHII